MGCASSSQQKKALDGTKPAELPSLLNTAKIRDSADRGVSKVSAVSFDRDSTAPRRTMRCTVLGAIDHGKGIEQFTGEEAADVLMQVAQEADALDQETKPMIAMVAHDNMKPLMASFAKSYKNLLADFRLTGTGTTCKLLRAIGLEPEEIDVPSGPLGGDQVLGAMICQGDVRALFFFQDPLSAHAHAADINALSRLCNVYQIYFATNYRSAGAILEQVHRNRHSRTASIRVPDGMSTDLGRQVQANYKKTRELAVAAAVSDPPDPPEPGAADDAVAICI